MNIDPILVAIQPILTKYDVPLPLVEAIIQVESGFDSNAQGDFVDGKPTSFGLFQLHLGGQANAALEAITGHSAPWSAEEEARLYDPLLNAEYAMPAIASAWDALKSSFDETSPNWWRMFAARSGHPGGNSDDPATQNEAHKLQAAYQTFVVKPAPIPGGVARNSHGEVADFIDESQFEGGESAYECVAFCAALCRYAGVPGKGPTGTGEQVDSLADYWYAKLEGSVDAANKNGMSLDAEYAMLKGLGLPYRAIEVSIESVKSSLHDGFPVLICGAEDSFFDLDLGDKVPYSWTPTGNHCLVASGIASDGNLLVRDTASIGTSGVRPGPRHYDAGRMQLISATAITMSWLPTAPVLPLPAHLKEYGWTDNGHILYSPTRIPVVEPFRTYILTRSVPWQKDDVPLHEGQHMTQLEESNPKIGGGLCQFFTITVLEQLDGQTKVSEMHAGAELFKSRQTTARWYNAYQQLLTALQQKAASK